MSNSPACLIEFKCIQKKCLNPILFNLGEVEQKSSLDCPHCGKLYVFHQDFIVKMSKFVNLINAVQNARDILGDTSVAVQMKDQEVKIPYRLLLTRMNTLITLKMDEGELTFRFRVEPLNTKDVIR